MIIVILYFFPHFPFFRNDLGLVLESGKRYEEASECFLTSLQLESTAPIISYTSIPRGFKAFDTS